MGNTHILLLLLFGNTFFTSIFFFFGPPFLQKTKGGSKECVGVSLGMYGFFFSIERKNKNSIQFNSIQLNPF